MQRKISFRSNPGGCLGAIFVAALLGLGVVLDVFTFNQSAIILACIIFSQVRID